MATTIDESADRSRDALERLAAAAERAQIASEENAMQSLKDTAIAKQLAAEEKAAADAAARFKAKMDTATGAAGALADSFVTYNKEIYKGSSANQAAAASIEKMGEAAKYAGAFLAILVPGGPIVKAFVAGLGLAAAKASELGAELARQTDSVYKSYQDLAKAGATGAGGMQDVFDGLQKVGLGTEKFGEYLKLVNENSKDLALFGGSVLKGRKAFEDTMGSLTREQRVQMELMGLDRTAQSEAVMGYIKQQRLLTMGTKTQMDTSSTAVMKYIKETDELTRITGMNRQEQQKALDEAMSREQFAASIAKIQREQGKEAAEAAKNTHAMLYAIDPKAGRQFADSISGFIGSSEDAQQGFMATGGKITEIGNRFMTGQIKNQQAAVAAAQELATAYGETAEQFEGQALMGNLGSMVGSVQMLYKMQQAASNDLNKNYEQAVKDAEKRGKTTEDMAKAENAAREHQLFLQRELNKGMDAFVTSLGKGQTANQAMIDSIMNDILPVFKDLFDALKPLGIELLKLVKELAPFLTTAMQGLIEAVKFLTKILNVFNNAEEETNLQSGEVKNGTIIGGASGMGDASAILDAQEAGPDTGYKKPSTMPAWMKKWAPWLDESRKPAAPGGGEAPTAEAGMAARTEYSRNLTMSADGVPIDARAAGGPVSAKTPYLVGEEGPELFVPSMAGEIIPTGQLQGTTGTALKQNQEIENLVNQIVLDTKLLAKTSDTDTERAKDHSKELKTQREKIDNAIKEIAANSQTLGNISKTDLKRAQDYSIFYKGFIETKTKFEKEQLDAINYQLTEGSANRSTGGGTGLKMPSMPGIAGMGGGQGIQATKQDDLKKLGLNIKEGDVQAEGAGVSPKLIELARQIQSGVPGFGYFSAFNDKFHQEKASGSEHAKGLALDFTVAQPPSVEDGKAITDWLKGLGASLAIDEYNNPSSKSTAGHFHAQIPGFEEGGMLGAGKVGIAGEGGKPELISGPASITPMNDLMGALNSLNANMEQNNKTLAEIARISRATSDSSAKMLSYAQN
jgi:hypothetical protein